ncbi:MAG: isoprenylcysteine carboxylmethyltransferase family protein [Promethearchaeota archaeon]|nr:MAG: isoprenylcysteine carboxylmethyltransferase family protein [Candidatus Lokiarchaeota archaeon]
MQLKRHKGHEREFPNAHIYHALLPVVFISIWFLDSFFFEFSTVLNHYIPFLIRLSLFILIFGIALIFIYLSHNTLFKTHEPPDSLITDGIFKYTRNPMYFGILLIYIASLAFSISLIAALLIPVIFYVYNRMVNFEENVLFEMFGEEYKSYQAKVPKWI